MIIVPEKIEESCGVCALAGFLHISWDEAADLIFPEGHPHWKYEYATRKSDLIKALKRYSDKFKIIKDRSVYGWHIPANSFVRIEIPIPDDPFYSHWALWDGAYIYDSMLRKPATLKQYNWWNRDCYPMTNRFHYFTVEFLP